MSLSWHDLRCGYSDQTGIEIPNYQLNSNGLIAILGANGSGKTTILKTLCGLLKPQKGQVQTSENPLWISTDLDWDLQLTPSDILDLYDIPAQARSEFILKLFNLNSVLNRRLSELSSGEKRRVALAVALCHRSSILILDEPTNFLEYRARIHFAQQLNQLAQDKLILFSTHEIEWLSLLPQAQCWIVGPDKKLLMLPNSEALVENSQLVPIFGGVFRSFTRSSSPSQKILYFDPVSSEPIRAPR